MNRIHAAFQDVSLALILAGMLSGCAGGAGEPPFETVRAAHRMEEAEAGFGWYVYQPKGAEQARVHRITLEGAWERGFTELPVEIYYPPGFSFTEPEGAVLVVAGSTEWSATISLAAMLAAEDLPAVVLHSQAAGKKLPEAIEAFRSRARELYIDPGSLAIWSEGHSVPEALACLLDGDAEFHRALRAGAFLSPVMYVGAGNMFVYEREAMSTDIPLFIAKAADDGFYEVNESVRRFREAARRYGIAVRYEEVPTGGHNWMLEEDDPRATGVLKLAVRFVKDRLPSN
jgi:hypothetical protein